MSERRFRATGGPYFEGEGGLGQIVAGQPQDVVARDPVRRFVVEADEVGFPLSGPFLGEQGCGACHHDHVAVPLQPRHVGGLGQSEVLGKAQPKGLMVAPEVVCGLATLDVADRVLPPVGAGDRTPLDHAPSGKAQVLPIGGVHPTDGLHHRIGLEATLPQGPGFVRQRELKGSILNHLGVEPAVGGVVDVFEEHTGVSGDWVQAAVKSPQQWRCRNPRTLKLLIVPPVPASADRPCLAP